MRLPEPSLYLLQGRGQRSQPAKQHGCAAVLFGRWDCFQVSSDKLEPSPLSFVLPEAKRKIDWETSPSFPLGSGQNVAGPVHLTVQAPCHSHRVLLSSVFLLSCAGRHSRLHGCVQPPRLLDKPCPFTWQLSVSDTVQTP